MARAQERIQERIKNSPKEFTKDLMKGRKPQLRSWASPFI
jgi:hypothetical protein